MRISALLAVAAMGLSACAEQALEPITTQTYTGKAGVDGHTVALHSQTVPGCDGRANSLYRGNLYCLRYR